jgi:ABC-type branched-subunit amino acid transport system ATPase component
MPKGSRGEARRLFRQPRDRVVDQATGENGGQPVLELKGLCKSFGGLNAVRDVNLKVSAGDRKAIIGPNGAGKTTLFNVITGIFPATSGQVLLFGQDVTGWPSHRRTGLGMARTFQVTSLFPKLTVLDNVLLAINGLRRSKLVMWRLLSSYRDVYDKAHELLEQAEQVVYEYERASISLLGTMRCGADHADASAFFLA